MVPSKPKIKNENEIIIKNTTKQCIPRNFSIKPGECCVVRTFLIVLLPALKCHIFKPSCNVLASPDF